MIINGREIKFLRTVKATSDISNLCPNKDIANIKELFNDSLSSMTENQAKIISYLNEGYEMNKYFMDRSYKPSILSVDEIMYLDEDTFIALWKEAMDGMNNGAETTVEVQENKKNETEVAN